MDSNGGASRFSVWLETQERSYYPVYIEQALEKILSIRRAFLVEDNIDEFVAYFDKWLKERPVSAAQLMDSLIEFALAGVPMPWEPEHKEKIAQANARRLSLAMMPEPETDEGVEPGNKFEFWVAYQEGSDGKLNYLGDGKGNLRLFKTQMGLQAYLDKHLTSEQVSVTVIHSIQGKIAIPKSDDASGALMPISTLLLPTVPSAEELLEEKLRRKKGSKR